MERGLQHLDRWRDRYARLAGKMYDLQALHLLRPYLPAPYTPWSKAALRPGAVACILNEIVVQRRRAVVEFGAGVSTLLIARCLRDCGGRLIAVEHDEDWVALIGARLEAEGLDRVARVVRAPLAASRRSLDGSPWYDEAVVHDALGDEPVDLMICDGPPAYGDDIRLARFPALPAVIDQLAPDCAIFLDDIDRGGEREIARRWGQLLGVPFAPYLLRGSFARAVRGRDLETLI